MSFFLERPFWLILIFALIPLWLHWRKGLTRQSRLRANLILTLRCLMFLFLTAALVGPVVTWRNYSKFVVCAVDVSGSIPEGAWDNQQFPNPSQGNQCIFLPFARTPGIITSNFSEIKTLKERPETPDFGMGCDPNMTNLSAALGAAAALAPEDYVPEVILYSDGTSNLGPIPQNVSDSVPVHIVKCPTVGKNHLRSSDKSHAQHDPKASQTEKNAESASSKLQAETWIERFEAPVSAYEGEVVGMDLFVHATTALGELKMELRRNGESVETQTLVFEKPGVRGVRFQVPVVPKFGEKKPLTEWDAFIYPAEDSLPQNNHISAVTQIVPHQKILLVERAENLGKMLRDVLKKEFIEVETCLPENMPTTEDEFRKFGLVILSNIPGSRIPQGTLNALKTFVSNWGGGLLVIGGDQAFTSGGYRGTPIENLLPVFCVEDKKRPREGLALALVVDRSGSMEGEAIALAREAVKGAMEVLDEQDLVGVHIFADTSGWVIPFWNMTSENKKTAFKAIDQITAVSGTNMDLALEKAARALMNVSAERKHIIVMTDGISIPANFMATAHKIRESEITLSTIALGNGAEPKLLKDLAQIGRGNAYVCVDPNSMPKIFAVETASAAKIGVVEGRTPVKQISSIPGFLNFNFTKVPPLLGYVQTVAKPEARVIFAAESKDKTKSDDPILAWWKSGNGKVMAFTSDMESPQWLQTWRGGWPDFDRFWGRLVAHTIRKNEMDDFRIQTAFHGDWLTVTLKVPNEKTLDGTPNLILGNDEMISLLPIAPGIYGAKTKVEPGRKNDLTLNASVNGKPHSWTATTVQSFTDEFRPNRQIDANPALEKIAKETKGSLETNLASIFPVGKPAPDAPFVLQTFPVWRFLLLLAVLIWMTELGIRRAKN